jgi:hypothetical protein
MGRDAVLLLKGLWLLPNPFGSLYDVLKQLVAATDLGKPGFWVSTAIICRRLLSSSSVLIETVYRLVFWKPVKPHRLRRTGLGQLEYDLKWGKEVPHSPNPYRLWQMFMARLQTLEVFHAKTPG